jgi:hypothetical protein
MVGTPGYEDQTRARAVFANQLVKLPSVGRWPTEKGAIKIGGQHKRTIRRNCRRIHPGSLHQTRSERIQKPENGPVPGVGLLQVHVMTAVFKHLQT